MNALSRTICPLVALLINISAVAQVAPSLPEKVVKSATMDGDAKKQVAEFIEGIVALLRSEDPLQVRKGRESFVKTIGSPSVNPAFRTSFSAMILPQLKEIIATAHHLQAVNALEAMKLLGAPDALSALTDQAAIAKQADSTIRLAAASGLPIAIRQTDLNTAQAEAIVKTLAASIDKETDWRILAYQLQALEVMSISKRAPKSSQNSARIVQGNAISSILIRIKDGKSDPELVRAVVRNMAQVLGEQAAATDPAAMAAFAVQLKPGLEALTAIIKKPPTGFDPAYFVDAARMGATIQELQGTGSPAKPPRRTAGAGKNAPAK